MGPTTSSGPPYPHKPPKNTVGQLPPAQPFPCSAGQVGTAPLVMPGHGPSVPHKRWWQGHLPTPAPRAQPALTEKHRHQQQQRDLGPAMGTLSLASGLVVAPMGWVLLLATTATPRWRELAQRLLGQFLQKEWFCHRAGHCPLRGGLLRCWDAVGPTTGLVGAMLLAMGSRWLLSLPLWDPWTPPGLSLGGRGGSIPHLYLLAGSFSLEMKLASRLPCLLFDCGLILTRALGE